MHLSTTRDLDRLVTNVHELNEASHGNLVQLELIDSTERTDSFHFDVLSDQFQPKPKVVLVPLPPTQQPWKASPHNS